MAEAKSPPEPRCPIHLGEPCSLCVPGASGPQDCGLVYLVMSDPDLRERLHELSVRHHGPAPFAEPDPAGSSDGG